MFRRWSRLLGINQRKQNAARLRATIDPGMIGRLLDDDIAGLHVHHRVVKHHVDLAGQHVSVIDGPRAVQRMPYGKTFRRRALAAS